MTPWRAFVISVSAFVFLPGLGGIVGLGFLLAYGCRWLKRSLERRRRRREAKRRNAPARAAPPPPPPRKPTRLEKARRLKGRLDEDMEIVEMLPRKKHRRSAREYAKNRFEDRIKKLVDDQ